MELFLLDPRKWIGFLKGPTAFLKKRREINLRTLIIEFLIFTIGINFIFILWENLVIEKLFERVIIGTLEVFFLLIILLLFLKILKKKTEISKITYSIFLPYIIFVSAIGTITVAAKIHQDLGLIISILPFLVYTTLSLKTFTNYSALKTFLVLLIGMVVSNFIVFSII